MLTPCWTNKLQSVVDSTAFFNLIKFIRDEVDAGYQIRPEPQFIFRALNTTDFHHAKVVILGQDPYPGQNHANGLAFAVNQDVALPKSLCNIFKEIQNDIGYAPVDKTLLSWANQGVLLLNTILTTREGVSLAHKDKGWEQFTDAVIQSLNKAEHTIVFLLWGSTAHKKQLLITNPKHSILTAPHPSPLSAHRGFFGCKHFSKTNEILISQGLQPIRW